MVPSSPAVWACGVSTDIQDDQGRAPLLSYVAFGGNTVVSLEVLDGIMWLFPECSNQASWLRFAKKQQFIKLFTEGRWGTSPLNWYKLGKKLGRKEWEALKWTGNFSGWVLLNQHVKVMRSAICLNKLWGPGHSRYLCLVSMALDVPRGVQKPTLRVVLPVGVCTAALGTK